MLASARAFGLAAMLAALLGLAWVSSARAAIYWGVFDGSVNPPNATVGAAGLDGGAPTSNYLKGLPSPGSTGTACGVAVSDTHLYWAGDRGIGRVNLDGSAVPATIVPTAFHTCGLTVDKSYVYWADFSNGTIGRANLDGSAANPAFIAGSIRPCDVAVSGEYLYWAEPTGIGRVKLDGSERRPHLVFEVLDGCGLAVRGDYLYWGANGAIARANVDGTEQDPGFIAGTGSVEGIATDASHLYWVDHPPGALASIGRANLDGSEPNRAWIPSDPAGFLRNEQSNVLGVAVDARPSPPPLLLPSRPIQFGKAQHDAKAGTVTLDVWVPDWGTLQVSSPGLRAKVVADSVPNPKRGGALRWRVTLKPLKGRQGRRIRAQLKNKGVAAVTVTATFTLERTAPVSAVRHLKLRKRTIRPNPR